MSGRQVVRYAAVGLSLNAALYGVYLFLTHTLTGSRVAMTLTYFSGVLLGFAFNRKFTFRFEGKRGSAFYRYILAYAVGYGFNFAGLWLLVDRFGFPHEIVQGGFTLGLPAMFYLLQRYWVFPAHIPRYPARAARSTP